MAERSGAGRGIWTIWAAGAVLAIVLIAIGPAGLGAFLGEMLEGFRARLSDLGPATVAVLRALAIAVLVVFIGLCGLASRQRLAVGRTLFAVGLVFVLLVAWPSAGEDGLRWSGALILALVASIVMTGRLLNRRGASQPDGTRNGPFRGPAA